MQTTRYPGWMCWSCGYMANAIDGAPVQGDMAVCLNCGAAAVLDSKQWRQMTDAELASLDPEERRDLAEHQVKQAIAKESGIIPDLTRRGGKA
jgi:hypothetical protein